MATLQELSLGYYSRAGVESATSGFSTLRISHYATWGWGKGTRPSGNIPGQLIS
jgi:hypothetical protein